MMDARVGTLGCTVLGLLLAGCGMRSVITTDADGPAPDSGVNGGAGVSGAGGPCGHEACDPTNLGGMTCASLGAGGGTLTCDPVTCTFDLSLCNGVQLATGNDTNTNNPLGGLMIPNLGGQAGTGGGLGGATGTGTTGGGTGTLGMGTGTGNNGQGGTGGGFGMGGGTGMGTGTGLFGGGGGTGTGTGTGTGLFGGGGTGTGTGTGLFGGGGTGTGLFGGANTGTAAGSNSSSSAN